LGTNLGQGLVPSIDGYPFFVFRTSNPLYEQAEHLTHIDQTYHQDLKIPPENNNVY